MVAPVTRTIYLPGSEPGGAAAHASEHLPGGDDEVPIASTGTAGLMSVAQATKLDGIEAGATNGGLYPAVVTDIDFAALADSGAFADGPVAIDGVNWTARNTAAATTFQITNGTGLQFVTAGVSGEFHNTSRTAAHIGVAASTLIPTFDALGTYLIEAYFSDLTFTSANNRVLVGMMRDTNTDRVAVGGFAFGGNNLGSWTQLDASGGQINHPTHNCAIVRLSPTGIATYSGEYSSGFPTPANRTSIGVAVFGTTTVNSFNVLDPAAEFVIAFRTATTAAGMTITLEHLRITRLS